MYGSHGSCTEKVVKFFCMQCVHPKVIKSERNLTYFPQVFNVSSDIFSVVGYIGIVRYIEWKGKINSQQCC